MSRTDDKLESDSQPAQVAVPTDSDRRRRVQAKSRDKRQRSQ